MQRMIRQYAKYTTYWINIMTNNRRVYSRSRGSRNCLIVEIARNISRQVYLWKSLWNSSLIINLIIGKIESLFTVSFSKSVLDVSKCFNLYKTSVLFCVCVCEVFIHREQIYSPSCKYEMKRKPVTNVTGVIRDLSHPRVFPAARLSRSLFRSSLHRTY